MLKDEILTVYIFHPHFLFAHVSSRKNQCRDMANYLLTYSSKRLSLLGGAHQHFLFMISRQYKCEIYIRYIWEHKQYAKRLNVKKLHIKYLQLSIALVVIYSRQKDRQCALLVITNPPMAPWWLMHLGTWCKTGSNRVWKSEECSVSWFGQSINNWSRDN